MQQGIIRSKRSLGAGGSSIAKTSLAGSNRAEGTPLRRGIKAREVLARCCASSLPRPHSLAILL